MRIRSLARALLAFSLVVTPCAAQQQRPAQPPPQQQPGQQPPGGDQQDDVEKVTVNLVQFDVIATDKQGRPVTDLRPEEFEISEDGKRQQITHFSFISAGPATATTAGVEAAAGPAPARSAAPVMPAPLPREQVRRTVALVVDDLGLSHENVGAVRKALREFVDEQMQPNDLVAILRTSSGIGALQQFTSDKRQLHRSIESVNWYPQGRAGLSTYESLNEDSAGSDRRDVSQFTQEMEEARAGSYTAGTFNSVGAIVRGLGQLPGRKSLVLFSETFRLSGAQGRNQSLYIALGRLADQANAASVSIYTVDASGVAIDSFSSADQPGARAYIINPQEFADTAKDANFGSVKVNDPPRTLGRADTLSAQSERDSTNAFRRLGALMEQRNVIRNESHTVLSYLADKTGGLFMRNRNDLGGAVERIMDDQRGYYLIAYRPADETIDPATKRPRVRAISVKVKRPGVSARTRELYFGVPTTEGNRARPRTRDEQIAEALTSPFASSDVGVRLTSLFGTDPASGSPFIRSLLHVDAEDLSFKTEANGARTTELEVVVVTFDSAGQVVDQMSYPQTVRAQSEEEYRRYVRDGLIYILNFPVRKPGAYQMRAAVREASSEKTGSAMQYVEVPNLEKKRLALSGIVLSGIVQTAAAGATPAAADVDPQSGPAVRRLRQGMLLDYRYNIHNATAGPDGRPQVTTQMRLFRDGKEVFTGKVAPLDASQQQNMKRLAAAGRIRVGPELVPGRYVLQVTVIDTLAPPALRTSTQFTDFEIVQ